MNEEKELPTVPIASSDLQMIGYVLLPYAQMIHRIIEPSSTRNALLSTIATLRQRLSAVTLSPGGARQPFLLTHDELAVIDRAFSTFVENMCRFVPPSQERDEIMQACEALRSYLMLSFAPPSTTNDE